MTKNSLFYTSLFDGQRCRMQITPRASTCSGVNHFPRPCSSTLPTRLVHQPPLAYLVHHPSSLRSYFICIFFGVGSTFRITMKKRFLQHDGETPRPTPMGPPRRFNSPNQPRCTSEFGFGLRSPSPSLRLLHLAHHFPQRCPRRPLVKGRVWPSRSSRMGDGAGSGPPTPPLSCRWLHVVYHVYRVQVDLPSRSFYSAY